MSFGERLRKLRTHSGMSVQELAEQVGVSRTFIYQLQRDRVSLSFSTLKGIARALGVSTSVLVDNEISSKWILVHKDERKTLMTDQEGVDLELPLFRGPRSRQLMPLFFRLDPGATLENIFSQRDSEELVLVHEGTLTAVAGESTIHMAKGDTAYFLLEHLETLSNHERQPASGLILISQPEQLDETEASVSMERRDVK